MTNEIYLKAGIYTDSDHPSIRAYVEKHTKEKQTIKEKIIQLYYTIRDGFRYNPYHVILKPYAMKASYLLTKDYGYCIEKSNLFAACVRTLGVPSRLGFANVRNHLATGKLEAYLGTDLLVFHGYTELFIDEKWVKATPVFDIGLCEKLNVLPLDFDAENDSIFQESDKIGNPFMDYVDDLGIYADLPVERFKEEMQKHYPHLFKQNIYDGKFVFEFE